MPGPNQLSLPEAPESHVLPGPFRSAGSLRLMHIRQHHLTPRALLPTFPALCSTLLYHSSSFNLMQPMKKVAGFILLVVVLVLTNPGIEEHKQAYREAFKRESPIANFLGVDNVGAALLTYDDYVVFSVTRMDQEVFAIGILGTIIPGGNDGA